MKFLTNLTIWKKITLLTALGLLLGVGVFSSLGMRAVNQATETMLQDRLTTARLVADYLDETLGRALTELKKTAVSLENDGTNATLESQIATLEDTYSRLSIYTHSIYLLNEEGLVIWSKPKDLGIERFALSSYPSISQAITRNEACVSGIVSAPAPDAPVIFLASPTKEWGEGNIGVLLVAIDLTQSSIGGFVKPITLGKTGYVEVVDQNGIVVIRTEPGPKLAPFEKSDHSGRFATLIRAGQPTQGVCHTCHEPAQKVERKDVLAFVPLSEAKWGVIIRQSEDEALTPVRELQRRLLLFGIALVFVALLFVVITTRDVGSRIRLLTTASQRIADGDLISPVNTLGKDEIGILGETLDDMRVKLKASYGELEQKTKELSSLLLVSEILTSTFDLSSLLNAVLAKAVEVIPSADGGALLLQNVSTGQVVVQSSVGLETGNLSHLTITSDCESPLCSVSEQIDYETKGLVKNICTNFLQSDYMRNKTQSSICAPVLRKSQCIGSLIMTSSKDTQTFSESDRRLLQAIADYVAIAIDRAQLTEEAEKAKALYEADRLRAQFLSSVSHELRTPLTLIKGYSTSMLRQDAPWDTETQREFLQIIDEKADELRDLIDKLLQSAKLEAGALKLEKEPVLIPRLVQRVVEDILSRSGNRKVIIEFAPSFPVVEADVRCIEQVVRNLVENAVKYSSDECEIIVAGEIKDNKVVVSVSDNGMGIPPEHQDKVFERFYRVDSILTRGIPGSGLGLSITKGHVEAHGGSVWLESTDGKGSNFCFSLPLERVGNSKKSRRKVVNNEKDLNSIG